MKSQQRKIIGSVFHNGVLYKEDDPTNDAEALAGVLDKKQAEFLEEKGVIAGFSGTLEANSRKATLSSSQSDGGAPVVSKTEGEQKGELAQQRRAEARKRPTAAKKSARGTAARRRLKKETTTPKSSAAAAESEKEAGE